MKKLLCKLFDHKWKLDYPNLPRSRKCIRCGKVQQLNVQKTMANLQLPSVWEDIEGLSRKEAQLN